ncbi:MAG: hypothetical protein JXA21_02905 [Anaerolineae bacterium]|nr:hypothetical protein [Anaerolineae bacterium]
MGKQEDELRRLQRLRDEQLRSRDPTAKDRATQQRLSARHRSSRKRITLTSIIRDFPFKWLLMIVGGLIGIVVAIIINLVIPNDPTVRAVGIIIVIFGFVAGRMMGAIRDWGDEDWGTKR